MTSHRQTLVSLLRKHRWNTGAELGVERGILAQMLLDANPHLSLVGVDDFSFDTSSREMVEALAERYTPRFRLLAMTTDAAAEFVPDRSLDFVFIDAEHSEERTFQDIQHWKHKVKPGGWFGGDAYNPEWYPQVLSAVHRVYPKDQVHVWPGRVWGVRA